MVEALQELLVNTLRATAELILSAVVQACQVVVGVRCGTSLCNFAWKLLGAVLYMTGAN
jgi:hypothetical protein